MRSATRGLRRASSTSYGEALAAEVATIRASAAEAASWAVENVRVRAGFHELVAALCAVDRLERAAAADPAGARARGLDIELRSNDAVPSPDGWRLVFRDEGVCPVCDDKCKRRSLPAGRPLDLRRRRLLRSLRSPGPPTGSSLATASRATSPPSSVPFEPFETLHDVAAALTLRPPARQGVRPGSRPGPALV